MQAISLLPGGESASFQKLEPFINTWRVHLSDRQFKFNDISIQFGINLKVTITNPQISLAIAGVTISSTTVGCVFLKKYL